MSPQSQSLRPRELTARLALRFDAAPSGAAHLTRLRVILQDPPLRVVRAFEQSNGATLVHLHNLSGGVLAGDQLSLDIDLAPSARAQITTTGATRLYRHRAESRDSSQQTTIRVGENAVLEYLPDAIIPYAGSRHTQSTEIVLDTGATLFWWEILAPGRLAMGEKFAFDHLRFKTRVFCANSPSFLDDFALAPHEQSPEKSLSSPARLGGFSHLANFYAFQPGRSASASKSIWRELENLLNNHARTLDRSGTIWGASALAADGMIVRGLSHSARDLAATLAGFWRIARRFLLGDEVVLPRKIY